MSVSLACSLAVMAASQLFKVIAYSARDGRLRLFYLFSTGGMPSAHSAFVTTLAVSLALWRGLSSEVFAICAVFASITIYVSLGLRGTVDIHTRILRDLLGRVGGSSGISIPRWVGHSVAETVVGIVGGSAAAVAAYLGFRSVFPGGVIPL